MNLIRYNNHIVAETDLTDTCQFLPGPRLAYRIMGLQRSNSFTFGSEAFLLQSSEINPVRFVYIKKGILHYFATVIADGRKRNNYKPASAPGYSLPER